MAGLSGVAVISAPPFGTFCVAPVRIPRPGLHSFSWQSRLWRWYGMYSGSSANCLSKFTSVRTLKKKQNLYYYVPHNLYPHSNAVSNMDSISYTAITDYVSTLTLEEFHYEGGRGFGAGSSLIAQDRKV